MVILNKELEFILHFEQRIVSLQERLHGKSLIGGGITLMSLFAITNKKYAATAWICLQWWAFQPILSTKEIEVEDRLELNF